MQYSRTVLVSTSKALGARRSVPRSSPASEYINRRARAQASAPSIVRGSQKGHTLKRDQKPLYLRNYKNLCHSFRVLLLLRYMPHVARLRTRVSALSQHAVGTG